MISLIVAQNKLRVIAREEGGLPWFIESEKNHFHDVIQGAPVITTKYNYLLSHKKSSFGPFHIVTRDLSFKASNVTTYKTVNELLVKSFSSKKEYFVLGGRFLYQSLLPFASKLYLSVVDDEVDSSIKFPHFRHYDWNLVTEYEVQDDPLSWHYYYLEKNPLHPGSFHH